MAKISLKVEIAGRTYPLTVQEGEDVKVLKAADDINKAITLLRNNYAVSDTQDLLAMSTLQMMMKGVSTKIEKEVIPADYAAVESSLQSLTDELNLLD